MKTKTEKILSVLRAFSWVLYIGSYLILGLIILTVLISFIWPEAKINFKGIITNQAVFRENHTWVYSLIFLFTIAWSILNVMVWAKIKKVLYEVNLKNPFSKDISKMLESISFLLFGVWLFGFSLNGVTGYFSKTLEGIEKGFDTDFSFLFSAGIVYIISQIFKRGIEIQEENNLTV